MTTKNLEEIVNQVIEWFEESPVEVQHEFLNSSRSDLIKYHSSLGRSIRNEFKLWEIKWEPELEDGVDISPNHPDAVSMSIIYDVWETLRGRN